MTIGGWGPVLPNTLLTLNNSYNESIDGNRGGKGGGMNNSCAAQKITEASNKKVCCSLGDGTFHE